MASFPGFLSAIVLNTFLFSTVFWLYHFTRITLGNLTGSISLILYWTSFEYFYLNSEISWPWLHLGNSLANNIQIIQWYEITGTLGGTVWILILNLIITHLLKKDPVSERPGMMKIFASFVLVLGIPVLSSVYLYRETEISGGKTCKITVIQPGNNAYEKLSARKQSENLIKLASFSPDAETDYYLAPEIAITEEMREKQPEKSVSIPMIKKFLKGHPHSRFIFGAYTYGNSILADAFNSAVLVDTGKTTKFYHKSKLVIGVEKMPYPEKLKFLRSAIEKLGGSFSSFKTQTNRDVWISEKERLRIAPVICYESVYGEFTSEFIKNGANIIFIITNDSWWGNTPGHLQLLSYARIRSIETRRSIARAATTGISAFINKKGEITDSLGWGSQKIMSGKLSLNESKTFYVRHGDILGRISSIISIGLIVFLFLKKAIRIRYLKQQ